jgi:hypothetical protein
MARPAGRIVLMGSGETAPTMVTTHQQSVAGRPPGPAVLLETTYGFQENAEDISAKALDYFARNVGVKVEVVGLRRGTDDRAVARLRESTWAFAGPGSPTYALRQWRGGPVGDAMESVVAKGGVVVLASAAACTAGQLAVPVYEIYKAGQDPWWEEGLDLLGRLADLHVAVVPHFDNAEGGVYDTRMCYLGERRLSALEDELPEGVHVLGVDEHTAVTVDLAAITLTVSGRGGMTARVHGEQSVWPSGSVVTLAELRAVLAGGQVTRGAVVNAAEPAPQASAAVGMLAEAQACEARFDAAVADGDVKAMTAAVLDLDAALRAWAADLNQSDENDRAVAVLRSLIVRLGAAAGTDELTPVLEGVVALRRRWRNDQRWADADALRDALADAGIVVKDSKDGSSWERAAPG